ncbi:MULTISPECIES: response regulator transcription factor [Deinococcus]|jgi:DNA-binding NarL/FixJ family response regulator|uniref:Two component transcriptional regulator, LuxR family n=2 Tax=Deinococcus TaxID=1298 RepID=H8H3E0_DEIGI|nr:LuxR C-terminal-related transcriptional regulator [Deinococcus gobiensis]AFD28037.1 Two component transcriptional regulator, LuxR family [Deinococcus gobiensis I-0]
MSGARRTRLVLVSAQGLLREGLGQALRAAGVELLATLSPEDQVVRYLAALRPDVVLIDLDDASGRIRHLWPDMMTALPGQSVLTLSSGQRAGPGPWSETAHLGRAVTMSELLEDIERVHQGEFSARIQAFLPPPEVAPLLNQDRELLQLLAQGLGNRDIAATLHLSEKTIRNRLSKTFARLQVTNRTQAAMCAVRLGLA